MPAHGFNIAEEGHVILAMPPIDITGGVLSDVWSMAEADHCSIIISVGVSAAAFTAIIVQECDDFTPSNSTAIPFALYPEETALGDTLAAREAVLAAGRTPNAADQIHYVIEIDAAELTAGFPNLRVSLTNGANAVLASVLVILSGMRYPERGRTQIA